MDLAVRVSMALVELGWLVAAALVAGVVIGALIARGRR